MLNLIRDRGTVFVIKLNMARNGFVLQLVHLIFFHRDVSAKDIWESQVRAWRPNDFQVLELRNDNLITEETMR